MKKLKIIGFIICGVVLLAALLLGAAFVPAVQTWAVRKAVAGRPGLKLEVGRVAAGLSTTEIRDLRLVQDGLVITAPRVLVEYSAWEYLSHKRIDIERIEAQGLVIDTRQMPAAVSAAAPGVSLPAFVGIFHLAQLPLDVRLANLTVGGRALLSGEQAVDFTLQGGRHWDRQAGSARVES